MPHTHTIRNYDKGWIFKTLGGEDTDRIHLRLVDLHSELRLSLDCIAKEKRSIVADVVIAVHANSQISTIINIKPGYVQSFHLAYANSGFRFKTLDHDLNRVPCEIQFACVLNGVDDFVVYLKHFYQLAPFDESAARIFQNIGRLSLILEYQPEFNYRSQANLSYLAEFKTDWSIRETWFAPLCYSVAHSQDLDYTSVCLSARKLVRVYHPEYDRYYPDNIPPLHFAILNGDHGSIDQIIEEDPSSVNRLCPFGKSTLELSHDLKEKNLLLKLLNTFKQLRPFCLAYNDVAKAYEGLLVKRNLFDLTESERAALRAKVGEKYSQTLPKRPRLHQAALEGDLTQVCSILDADQSQVESDDPWGYRPIDYAIGEDHLDVVAELIVRQKQYESLGLTQEERRYDAYSLTNHNDARVRLPQIHAKTPAMMSLLFSHGLYNSDPEIFYDYVEAGHVKEANLMISYCDLECFDICYYGYYKAQRHVARGGSPDILRMILYYMGSLFRQFATEGAVYDPCLRDIAPITQKYNRALAKKMSLSLERTQVYCVGVSPQNLSLQSLLTSSNGETFLAKITRSQHLSDEQRQTIYRLFNQTFVMVDRDSDARRLTYLNKMFPTIERENSPVFVETWGTAKDGTVSYVAFEIKHDEHPACGPFVLLHIMLANVDGKFASKDITSFTLRIGQLLKKIYPHKKIICSSKNVAPYAAALTLPFDLIRFPEHYKDTSFAAHIANMMGETLVNGKWLQRKLKVKYRMPTSENPRLQRARDLMGDDDEHAMLCIFELDDENEKIYQARH